MSREKSEENTTCHKLTLAELVNAVAWGRNRGDLKRDKKGAELIPITIITENENNN